MEWSVLTVEDIKKLSEKVSDITLEGSDSSLVNLFLLQKKYNIKTCISGGFLFRYYSGSKNRTGYGFPVKLSDDTSLNQTELTDAVRLLITDAEHNDRPLKFCLLTENQKNQIQYCIECLLPEQKIEWKSERNDCDYIYSRKELAELAGKRNHKKKNHLSKFLRTYDGKWEFRSLEKNSVDTDLIQVAECWLNEKTETEGYDTNSDYHSTLEMELNSLKAAVENKNLLNLEGGVLYAEDKPVAMTVASKISNSILDVHYEKCLSHAAQNGGYAAINWCFANECTQYDYFNREEDMGIEGLRNAKLSYHPSKLLEKYFN